MALPLTILPPCTYSRPPADVKPWPALADGRPASSAAESRVQVMVAGSNACRSSRSPADHVTQQRGRFVIPRCMRWRPSHTEVRAAGRDARHRRGSRMGPSGSTGGQGPPALCGPGLHIAQRPARSHPRALAARHKPSARAPAIPVPLAECARSVRAKSSRLPADFLLRDNKATKLVCERGCLYGSCISLT
jgi:hypothetical protein